MAIERPFPCNIDAECCVLGSIIIDPDAVALVADFLASDDFYRDAHRTMYSVILQLYDQRTPADFITICDELERRSELEEVGGAGYITSLINRVPTSGNAVYYGRIVSRTALLRRLIAAGGQIVAQAYEDSEEEAALTLERAEQLIFEIGQRYSSSTATASHVRELLAAYMDRLDQVHEHRGTVLGVPTGFADLDRLLSGLQRSDLIILAARPSLGKCLTANTLVDDPTTGERLTLEECVQRRQPLIYGVSDEGKTRITAISDWIDSGIQPCYRVTTSTGRMVETTGHHPFLTVHGWTPLHDLRVGSQIAVPRSVPAFGTDEHWSLDMVRLLAYLIAEGGLTDSSPEFTNTDPVMVEDFKHRVATRFPALAIRQQRITSIVSRPAEGLKNPLTEWLRELGLMGKLAKEKHFPACVWMWSRGYLAEFLRVMMSCGGSRYASGEGHPDIECTVASQQLARDMQHAFTRFGIIAACHKRPVTCQGKHVESWRVTITEPDSVRMYREEIGWIGEQSTRLAESIRIVLKEDGGNNDHVPQAIWSLVREAAQPRSFSLREVARRTGETTKTGKYAGYHPQTQRNLPRYRLASYAAVFDHPTLRSLASPDIYWDEIVAIEYIGEHQVYDVTVPDGSNFVAQDIFVHNTALALNIAYNAAVRHQRRVGIFSLEMSKEQLIQRLLALGSGVDQQRLRTGWIEDNEWDRIVSAMGTLSEADIWIDDTSAISTMQLRSKARRWMLEHNLDLIIIDYLQLMQASSSEGRKQENRVQEVSMISRSLKGLARELNIPVLALAQLSRAVENRASKVPQLSDLRESGSLEADSDVVLLIYRDDVYNPGSERPNTADILVAKHRNGPVGDVCLAFEKQQTRFRDLTAGSLGEEGTRASVRQDGQEDEHEIILESDDEGDELE